MPSEVTTENGESQQGGPRTQGTQKRRKQFPEPQGQPQTLQLQGRSFT